MLKRYKNSFFQQVQKSGLSVSDFESEEVDDGQGYPEFCLRYKPANLSFILTSSNDNPDHFLVRYSRYTGESDDDPPEVDVSERRGFVSVDDAGKIFASWLIVDVLRSIEESHLPDLWAEAQAAIGNAPAFEANDEGPFSEEQKQEIRFAVRTFSVLIVQEFDLHPEQKAIIQERLEYLTNAVDRLSRRDWKGIAISTVIGITTNLSLDTERGRLLWGLFRQAMSSVLRLLH